MNRNSVVPWTALAVCGCLLLSWADAGAAADQAATAALTGQVLDASGAAVPGATIVVRQSATGAERSVVSDAGGQFMASALPAGLYTVTVDLPGFQRLTRESVELTGGQSLSLKLVLEVSAVEDSVVVRGTAFNYASSIAGKLTVAGSCLTVVLMN